MKTILRCATSLFLPAGILLAGGCSGTECYENHSALPLATFYDGVTLQPISLTGLEIYGIDAPGDSVLYPPRTLSEAYLPFRFWQDTTSYVFAYTGLLPDSVGASFPELVPRDTVTFVYTPREWFVSPACGAMYFFDMDTVVHSSLLIDSVAFNGVITNENVSNIKIFFHNEVAD